MTDPADAGETARQERVPDEPAHDGPSSARSAAEQRESGGAPTQRPGTRDRGSGTGPRPKVDSARPESMLEQMGGLSGLIYSAVPVVAFVLINGVFGLQPAIWGALGVALLITVLRVVRSEPVQPAISGLFGVAIAALIAHQTGSAKGYFLFGIWASAAYAGAMIASILVRWPLAGLVWNYLNGAGTAWRADKPSRRWYDIATFALAVVFGARFVVQQWLYSEDLTGWLAAAKIGMGYPLYGLALLVVVWAVRRSDRRLKQLAEAREQQEADIEADLRARYG